MLCEVEETRLGRIHVTTNTQRKDKQRQKEMHTKVAKKIFSVPSVQ